MAEPLSNENISKVKYRLSACIKLMESNNFSELLHIAVYYNDIATAEHLLIVGVDINYKDNHGYTIPALVTENGETIFDEADYWINFLLDHDADIDCINNFGETPLMLAMLAQDADKVRLLPQRGADISIRDPRGDRAIDYSSEWLIVEWDEIRKLFNN